MPLYNPYALIRAFEAIRAHEQAQADQKSRNIQSGLGGFSSTMAAGLSQGAFNKRPESPAIPSTVDAMGRADAGVNMQNDVGVSEGYGRLKTDAGTVGNPAVEPSAAPNPFTQKPPAEEGPGFFGAVGNTLKSMAGPLVAGLGGYGLYDRAMQRPNALADRAHGEGREDDLMRQAIARQTAERQATGALYQIPNAGNVPIGAMNPYAQFRREGAEGDALGSALQMTPAQALQRAPLSPEMGYGQPQGTDFARAAAAPGLSSQARLALLASSGKDAALDVRRDNLASLDVYRQGVLDARGREQGWRESWQPKVEEGRNTRSATADENADLDRERRVVEDRARQGRFNQNFAAMEQTRKAAADLAASRQAFTQRMAGAANARGDRAAAMQNARFLADQFGDQIREATNALSRLPSTDPARAQLETAVRSAEAERAKYLPLIDAATRTGATLQPTQAPSVGHPSGLSAEQARRAEAHGFHWNGEGWVK